MGDLSPGVRQLRANGQLRDGAGRVVGEGEFEVVRRPLDAPRSIFATFWPHRQVAWQWNAGTVADSSLVGMTAAGTSVELRWLTLDGGTVGSHRDPSLNFIANELRVGEATDPTRVTFLLPNFLFIGRWRNVSRRKNELRLRTNRFTVRLDAPSGPVTVAFQQVSDRQELESRLRERGGVVVTATATVRRVDGGMIVYDGARRTMDTVCALLALARGRNVDFVASRLYTGRALSACHFVHSRAHRWRAATPLISQDDPKALPQFLEQCYPAYRDRAEVSPEQVDWKDDVKPAAQAIREALDLYTEALQFRPLPAPVYAVAYAFEAMVNSELMPREGEWYGLSRMDIKRAGKSFRDWARVHLVPLVVQGSAELAGVDDVASWEGHERPPEVIRIESAPALAGPRYPSGRPRRARDRQRRSLAQQGGARHL